MAFLFATQSTTTNSVPTVPVPDNSGAIPLQADDQVYIVICFDSGTAVGSTPTVEAGDTPDAGFSVIAQSSISAPDGQKAFLMMKRLTGPDTGTYTFRGSVGTSTKYLCMAFALRGRHATDAPTMATNAENTTSNASPVTCTSGSLTVPAGADDFYICVPDVTVDGAWTGFTQPADFTTVKEFETNFHVLSVCVKDNSAGTSGTVAGTMTLSSGGAGYIVFRGYAPAAAGGGSTQAPRSASFMQMMQNAGGGF